MPLSPTVTVTVVSADAFAFLSTYAAVTVTVVSPAPSPTLVGLSDRATSFFGAGSSRLSVVPVTGIEDEAARAFITIGPPPARTVPLMVIVSTPSTPSSVIGRNWNVAVPLVCPFAIRSVTSFTAS